MSAWLRSRDRRRSAGRAGRRIIGSLLAMALAGASAAPGAAQSAALSSPGPSLVPVEGGPDADAADRDLWFHHGTTATRVDGRSGAVVERRDVSGSDCQVRSDRPVFAGPGRRDILLRKGALEFAEFDPDYVVVGSCILRIPHDGSAEESHAVPRARQAMVVNDIAVVDDTIWVVAWDRRSRQDTLDYYSDLALFRLDEQTGDLDLVRDRVLSVAPSAAGPVVLFTEKGRPREPRIGLIADPALEPRPLRALEDAIPTVPRSAFPEPRLRLATGANGLLALHDRYGSGDIVVFDPAADVLVGTVRPPRRIGSLGSVYPTTNGVWMDVLRPDGGSLVRFSGFGDEAVDIDPCEGFGDACFGSLEASTGDGVWLSAWPYDERTYEVDLSSARLRRYEDGGSQPSLELSGSDLYGP